MDGSDVEYLPVEGEEPPEPPAPRRNALTKRVTVVAVVVGALVLGGIGVAVAADNGSSSSSSSTPPSSGSNQAPAKPGGGPGLRRGFGFGGPGFGMGGAIHGELVTPNGSGGYRTVDVQVGEVNDVSSSSITVQSADGFKKTYDVTENTVVDSGRDGIGTVKKGDKVQVSAVVNGSTTEARSINDITTLGSIRRHWNPNAPMPGSNGNNGGSGNNGTTGSGTSA
ncbi:MAG TPA: hypothetical protein VIB48_00105 [Acidimicrobiia bacterium]